MDSNNGFLDKNYYHYNDYVFKSILLERANGLLRFIGIPYTIETIILSEYTMLTPGISRIDFAGDVKKGDKTISIILECQTKLPTEEDIKRFFQYVASLRIFKNNDVELYILCTQKTPNNKKEFAINDECIYTMHIISLKEFKAREIFKNIENKLENNEKITDEEIASLQVIVYTDYEESGVETLIRARRLFESIAANSKLDANQKKAVISLFDVLSVNMLNEDEINQYEEETYMLLNPTDRYLLKKGKDEGKIEGKIEGKREANINVAKNLLNRGFEIEDIIEITGLAENDILNAK